MLARKSLSEARKNTSFNKASNFDDKVKYLKQVAKKIKN